MYRAYFNTGEEDYRTAIWPIKHPYWVIGYELDGTYEMVAYVDDMEHLLSQWPEAENIEMGKQVDGYIFTSTFPKPAWFIG